jgi:flavin-dependent dehydrogenase
VFPKKEHLNVGFGIIQGHKKTPEESLNFLHVYHDYIAFLKEKNIIPKNLTETPVKGGALPTHPLEKTYAHRMLLVGDAAGFINPMSGEGIYYAMASGEIAARVITEALENNNATDQFLSRYETYWRKDFGRDINLIYRIVNRGGIENRERVFQIACQDKILTELMLGVITGELSAYDNKWKIITRYFYASLKKLFHRT